MVGNFIENYDITVGGIPSELLLADKLGFNKIRDNCSPSSCAIEHNSVGTVKFKIINICEMIALILALFYQKNGTDRFAVFLESNRVSSLES